MRDSFIFYRSFYEATQYLEKDQKADLFDAIANYALNQEQVKLDNVCSALFSLIKPQLDANYSKYLNGKKKAKKSKPVAKISKPLTNVNVNVNDNYNVNVNDIYMSFAHLRLSTTEFNKLLETYTKDQIDYMIGQIKNYKKNKNYSSLYLTLLSWLKKEHKNEKKRSSDFSESRAFGVSL
tara:strand:+ start:1948 stop:2487 length:540 start_codon:yes stop_codon:yes gene_type:complete